MAIDFKSLIKKPAAVEVVVEPKVEEPTVKEKQVVEAPKQQSAGMSFLQMLAAKKAEQAPKLETPAEIAVHNEIVEDALPKNDFVREDKPAANAFLARLNALKAGKQAASVAEASIAPVLERRETTLTDMVHGIPRIVVAGNPLNDDQMLACKYAMEGQSCVVTGAAGTGKTTAQAGVVQMLMEQDAFDTHDFKYIGEAPSIAICAFTKVAVRNIAKAIRKNPNIAQFAHHCMTIHALLEYEPVKEERTGDDGLAYEVRVFRPQRTQYNPLRITHLIVEEASMVGTDLWENLYNALLPGVQIIFLGDINQLQPVFGRPILGYALCKLPVIELTEVYRQALDNPIIANAHNVLKGKTIETSQDGRCAVVTGKSKFKIGQDTTAIAMVKMFKQLFEAGEYDPNQDMVLSAWNKKALGTININEGIATFLGAARGALVHEVRAGFNRWFLAVGDRVLVDKRAGTIVKIVSNPKYVGAACKPAGSWTRSGVPIIGGHFAEEVDFDSEVADEPIDYSDFSLGNVEAANEESEYKTRAASHIVHVVYFDQVPEGEDPMNYTGLAEELSSAGDFRNEFFQFGYCMTVHKSQGSEWRKVFFISHYDHAVSVSREMLYTALTRAREVFTAFCKADFLEAAAKRAEIKGESLQAKIEYFTKGIIDVANDDVKLIPPSLDSLSHE